MEYWRIQRTSRGITQREIADAIGITQSLYSKYERGVKKTPAHIKRRLRKVDYDALVWRTPSRRKLPETSEPKIEQTVETVESVERKECIEPPVTTAIDFLKQYILRETEAACSDLKDYARWDSERVRTFYKVVNTLIENKTGGTDE